jgi:hypothetical protein
MYSAITLTGRRVTIAPMKLAHTRIILAGQKDRTAAAHINRKLIEQLVTPRIDVSKLDISEETDFLYLIRLKSLKKALPFKYTCQDPDCKKVQEKMVDIRRFVRTPTQCSNPECKCHDFVGGQIELIETLLRDDDSERGTVDFSEIPEDHLETHPPKLTFTLPESGAEVVCQLPKAKDKDQIGQWLKADDPEILAKSLSKMVIDINNTIAPIRKETEKSKKSTRVDDAIIQALQDETLYDMFWLRDRLQEIDGGVDSNIDITCTECNLTTTIPMSMGTSFFLPRQVTSQISST